MIVGGPLTAADHIHRALLVVHGDSEEMVRARLAQDPWAQARILRTAAVGSGGHGAPRPPAEP